MAFTAFAVHFKSINDYGCRLSSQKVQREKGKRKQEHRFTCFEYFFSFLFQTFFSFSSCFVAHLACVLSSFLIFTLNNPSVGGMIKKSELRLGFLDS